MSSPTVLLEHFHALDAFLIRYRALWQPRPFAHMQLPWETDHADLADWLRQRTLEDAESIHNHPHRLPAPEPFPTLAAQAERLSRIPELPQLAARTIAARLSADVPGRKWQQIQHFSAALGFRTPPRHWLDWCAGKGHLGRLLATDGQRLTCLEWDPALVAEGDRLSQRAGISAEHVQQDVMAENAQVHLHPDITPVALHACGDLHAQLLHLSIRRGCRQLALAPCCYNRIQTSEYQPLSRITMRSQLRLSRDDLALPLSETVTAGARERRQRNQSMAWRLAFDLLQRQLRGVDRYLPTPSLPSAWLKKSFEQYCRDLAEIKKLPRPGALDWDRLERHGWQRLAEVRNLELVRALFRRPLELWLILDRAMLLTEHGYQVQWGTFCPGELTPRNIMLLAERETGIESEPAP